MKRKSNNKIDEATTSSISSGRYTIPISPGFKLFDKKTLEPFTIQVSEFDDAGLAFDSYDGKIEVSKKQAEKIEKKARQISKFIKNNPSMNDDDGDILNQSSGNPKESLKEQIRRILRESILNK